MGLDIRYPIGLMFGIIGLVMVVYGFLTGADPMYQRSLGTTSTSGGGRSCWCSAG